MVKPKQYLGDGVYAEYDEGQRALVLTTENGIATTNRIVFEAEVIAALLEYLDIDVHGLTRRKVRMP